MKKTDANEQLMRDILNEYVQFYADEDNPLNVYVEYPRHNGAIALEPVGSGMFQAFLGYQYREESDEMIAPDFGELLEIYVQNLRYRQNRTIRIHRRVAGSISKEKIFYFLADARWTTILINSEGYKKGLSKKLKFLKMPLDDVQVLPKEGGDVLQLMRKYVNMSDDDFLLFVVYLVQGFSRISSHFAAILSSNKGTGKSTLTRLIRAIVDPSKAGVSLMPSTEGDLKTLLGNSYLVCFDNTATLSTKVSNILCAAITGSKEAKRKLYTDADQVILNPHNMVVINGIDIVPYKSDLAERSLLFELLPISKEKRKTDSEFWSDFEADRPLILGAICRVLADAMKLMPSIQVTSLHRMADANREMLAIALALGITEDDFQNILWSNSKKLQAAYAQNNPFVDCVASFVKLKGTIYKPASEVYGEVLASIPGNRHFFPDSPSAFSRRLNEEKDALEQAGIRFAKAKRSDANYIRLEKIPKSQLTKAQKEAMARKVAADDASMED